MGSATSRFILKSKAHGIPPKLSTPVLTLYEISCGVRTYWLALVGPRKSVEVLVGPPESIRNELFLLLKSLQATIPDIPSVTTDDREILNRISRNVEVLEDLLGLSEAPKSAQNTPTDIMILAKGIRRPRLYQIFVVDENLPTIPGCKTYFLAFSSREELKAGEEVEVLIASKGEWQR